MAVPISQRLLLLFSHIPLSHCGQYAPIQYGTALLPGWVSIPSLSSHRLTIVSARPPYDYDDTDSDDWSLDDNDSSSWHSHRRRRATPDNFSPPSLSSINSILLAGAFVMGIGAGVTLDSQINTDPKDLASRDAVDRNAPNPQLCVAYGASAMAFDQRVFVSFNPFDVYVSQADVKPACVLRKENVVSVLKERKLLNDREITACRNNMNTWAFVGDLNDRPQLSCVYKSEDAQNEFLEDPKRGIGEDYLDDDLRVDGNIDTRKMVKDSLTEAQRKNRLEMDR